MKIKLNVLVDQGLHFYKWERPFFAKEFELVDSPRKDAVIFAFGPDAFERAAEMPASKRVALLFPGFGFNPYHNLEIRKKALELIEQKYDAVFVNPGPIEVALRDAGRTFSHPFSIDVDHLLKFRKIRTSISSLVHVSANAPQKDWERSRDVMELSRMRYEVFPPRPTRAEDSTQVGWADRLFWRYNKYVTRRLDPHLAFIRENGYVSHDDIVKKYLAYDGFVHVAAEKNLPDHIDGKYTATLLEAGLTGSILFWHDTMQLGNDFETIFSISRDPETAAHEINDIRLNLDVEQHSKMTSDEIAARCHPRNVVQYRRQVIEGLF